MAETMNVEQLLAEHALAPAAARPAESSQNLLGLTRLHRRMAMSDGRRNEPASGRVPTATLRNLLAALYIRDPATVRHSRRVAAIAVGIARSLGWENGPLEGLETAALLHDIEKIAVPDDVLFKPDRLNYLEAGLMAQNRCIAISIMQACGINGDVMGILSHSYQQALGLRQHNRNPAGHAAQGAKILAVADAYDSLSHEKSYRSAWSHEDILQVLANDPGVQFDGNVVAALARWCHTNGLCPSDFTESGGPEDPLIGRVTHQDAIEAASLRQVFSYLYMLEDLYDGFYLLDSDLRFVVWNCGLEQLLGHPAEEMRGAVWTSRALGYLDADGGLLNEREIPLRRALAKGKQVSAVVWMERAGDTALELEIQAIPVLDAEGRQVATAELFRDPNRCYGRRLDDRDLRIAATRDALTSLANRREIETQFDALLAGVSAAEDAPPASVMFVDLDFFKSINDRFGHAAGDKVLIDVARLLENETYSGEVIGRYGGEEFVILCPDSNLDQALRKAERLRAALPRAKTGGLEGHSVTASFGVAQVVPGETAQRVLERADAALYRAKESGRNKVCAASSTPSDADESEENPDGSKDQAFVYTTTFSACVADDVIVCKLGGFVAEAGAELVEVSRNRAIMRIGAVGWTSLWGRRSDRQPVEIEVQIGKRGDAGNESSPNQTEVTVNVWPLGLVYRKQTFRRRAADVVRLLRSYLLTVTD